MLTEIQSHHDFHPRLVAQRLLTMIVSCVLCLASAGVATSQDSVYQIRKGRKPQRIIGTIQIATPFEVTIKTSSGQKRIPASDVARIAIKDQPPAATRARDRFDDARYADCLAELDKLDENLPSPYLQEEVDFLNAAANAQLSLQGGEVTAQAAGTVLNGFLKKYPESHLKFPAIDLLGKLLFAFGRMDNASSFFEQLTESKWPEYEMRGHYYRGRSQMAQEKYQDAVRSYDAMLAFPGNDESTEQWKLLATCQKARCQGMLGDAETGLQTLRKIIKDENPDNAILFATAFNALGVCYFKNDQIPEARTEFLKTELLYPTATEPHAEALFYLAKIWSQMDETDRANRARATLKARYRNSWWTSQL